MKTSLLSLLFPLLLTAFTSGASVPLLTSKWGEGCLYNASCPNDPTATASCLHALAGSGAIAMAQVMRFHGYPDLGTGQHSYNHPVYGTLSVNFSAASYAWPSMADSLVAPNEAVATLVYHAGVAIETDFGPDRSASRKSAIDSAFKDYFGYSELAAWKLKDDYTANNWYAMIRTEIDAGRPVICYGDSLGFNGRYFVCDGYQGNELFHINWGNGGIGDGYYSLSILVPGFGNFTSNQAALFGLMPDAPAPPSYSMDFESIPLFSLQFGDWTTIDADGQTTYSIEAHTFPNNGQPMAFICFDPDSVTPSMGNDQELQPHGGNRFGASFSANPPSSNDWFISPQVQLNDNPELSFWVKSYTAEYGLEQYRVCVSTTGTNPADFSIISGSAPLEAPTVWTRMIFNLSAYKNQKVYVAIRCVSDDRFIFMVDDILIKPNAVSTLQADFSASKRQVSAGEVVNFFDQSTGLPNSWSWTFNGGSPGSSIQQNPQGVRFNEVGTFDVTLTISDGTTSNTVVKPGYITVSGYPSSVFLDFDSLADFTTGFSPWTTQDPGGGATYGITGVSFPGDGNPMAYICFNPSKTVPPLTNMLPHSGDKLGCAFASMPPNNPNNKWLISPRLGLGADARVTFWAKTYNAAYGLEKLNVAVSTTTNLPSAFTPLHAAPIEIPEAWTRFTYDLSAFTGQSIYVGFQSVSNDTFIFMIDDIEVTSTVGVQTNSPARDFTLFPNPARERVTLKFTHPGAGETTITLIDMLGNTVKEIRPETRDQEITFQIADLAPGIYTVSVMNNGSTRYSKVSVIQ